MSLPAPTPPGATDTVGGEGFGFGFEVKNFNAAHKPPTTATTPPPIHASTVRLVSSCKKAQMLSMNDLPNRETMSFMLFLEIYNNASLARKRPGPPRSSQNPRFREGKAACAEINTSETGKQP
jgi:hypothetical protein